MGDTVSQIKSTGSKKSETNELFLVKLHASRNYPDIVFIRKVRKLDHILIDT